MAAGGFVSRAFEAMLKECGGKKYPDLEKAIQSYFDNVKEVNQQAAPTSSETNQTASEAAEGSSFESQAADVPSGTDPADPHRVQQTDEKAEHVNGSVGINITTATALANAGQTLQGAQAEIILIPLRLAFESKNLKILESALDCLHKLIGYDHLEGDPGLEGGKNGPLFIDVLNMVCSCVDNSSSDSTILQVLKVFLTAVASTKFRVHGEPLLGIIRVCYNIALNSKSHINQATSKAMLTQMISIIFRRMETEVVSISSSYSGHSEATTVEDMYSKADETSSVNQNEKEMSLGGALNQDKEGTLTSVEQLQNLAGSADIKGLEVALEKVVHLKDGKNVTRGIDLGAMSIGHQDALLVFQTLCKMSMKEDNDEVTQKKRILSLELLQGLLEGVSHSFTKNFNFIDSVKAYLSFALLRASVSDSHVVFQYATGIFLVLLLRFRESLKGEIAVFFPLIVLRMLDAAGFPINQKLSVLRMLEKVCKDAQILVDIYVNYDCDPGAPSLFERMVTTLSKIVQGNQNSAPNSAPSTQAYSTKGLALQCLVNVLKSLIEWEKSRREASNQASSQSLKEEVSEKDSIELKREDNPGDFEREKAHNSAMEAAISEFNRQPVKGVDYLIANKLVENSPASVAQFLKDTPRLNKAMIGDYLGQHKEFPLSVMHAFVDSMNFSGMKFDTAIREFLKGFRLPGEAQKIDRIMEKFAERYCAENPGIFKSADTAYVLAYAVIMLNNDAHNPMVCPKMSKTDFIQMNAMNDAEECAPMELLEEVYDSIVKEEIKMKDDVVFTENNSNKRQEMKESGRLISILNLALPKRKPLSDSKFGYEAIIKKMQAIFRSQGTKRQLFYTSYRTELVRPMVEAVGWPLLATFSVTMEEGDNKPRIVLCMEGFQAGIHITHVLGMDTMRYAFLTSLVRFTFLHAPKEMRSKNVEALRTLLTICDSEPESLQDTWNALLECVSRLDFITSTPAVTSTIMIGSNHISRDAIVQSLKELAGKPAEQVFVNSTLLPSESVVEFFSALCGVSAEELKQSPARVFSLEKLVQISYYNMTRIRMVWARIWSVLANHFISAGSHHDEKIAMYAIDSLRQLGMKYLERAELANFAFQNDILRPFVVILRNSQSESIRHIIVDCIVQMIKSKVASIKSGWHGVFIIFTAAADDELETIVERAFENVEQVILEHFNRVVGGCFMDCVNCLIRFANNKSSVRISLKAIALLRICEDRLAEGFVPGGASKPIGAGGEVTYEVTEHYWYPMLAGLSDLTSDPRPEVRSCALEVLFDLLNERGGKFSTPFWESIFHRVLFPIFDHVRLAGKENLISSGEEWFRETTIHSLQLLCNLFNTFYKDVCFILSPLLSLLLDCAKKTDQTVVSISLGALVHLIEVGGHQFSESDWDTLLKSIRDAVYTTQPLELLNTLDLKTGASFATNLEANISDNASKKSIDNGEVDLSGSQSAISDEISRDSTAAGLPEHSPEPGPQTHLKGSEGLPSPSGSTQKPSDAAELQQSQTIGQRIMGNMMDNFFLRRSPSKSGSQALDVSLQSSPHKVPDGLEADTNEEASPLMETIRGKCLTQLLLLGAIDSIQKKYWNKLTAQQKIAVMDVLFSLLEFAATFNSCSNLRMRIHHIPPERPPLNLIRQELAGTCIYLDLLQKTTSATVKKDELFDSNGSWDIDTSSVNTDRDHTGHSDTENRLRAIAEEKLVIFCEQVLKEASELQYSLDESTDMDVHRVLELRSPVIVMVLKGMCSMNHDIFRRHLKEFYPLTTKLVCCDQMDIRGALGDLFSSQLKVLLPLPEGF